MNYCVKYSMVLKSLGNAGGVERFSDYNQARDRAEDLLGFLPIAEKLSVAVYGPESKKIWSYEQDKEKKT